MTSNTAAKIADDAMPTMRRATDELLKTAGNAVDSTRDYASDALVRAEGRARELRGSIDPVVDMLTSRAQKLARHSLDLATEAKYRAERSLKHASRATTRYVADQPVRSVLIAAAVGATVAWLISSSRHRNRNRY